MILTKTNQRVPESTRVRFERLCDKYDAVLVDIGRIVPVERGKLSSTGHGNTWAAEIKKKSGWIHTAYAVDEESLVGEVKWYLDQPD